MTKKLAHLSISSFILLLALASVSTSGFNTPSLSTAFVPRSSISVVPVSSRMSLNMGFFSGDGKERDKITRETEPQQFFQTTTDKMSDSEKLPLALAGIAFICLPFIAGLIALYAAK